MTYMEKNSWLTYIKKHKCLKSNKQHKAVIQSVLFLLQYPCRFFWSSLFGGFLCKQIFIWNLTKDIRQKRTDRHHTQTNGNQWSKKARIHRTPSPGKNKEQNAQNWNQKISWDTGTTFWPNYLQIWCAMRREKKNIHKELVTQNFSHAKLTDTMWKWLWAINFVHKRFHSHTNWKLFHAMDFRWDEME